MPIINVSWVKLPKANYEQLKNGTKGIVFKLSPQYVGKALYKIEGEDYWIRDEESALKELDYEYQINKTLFNEKIGNVPKPVGIEYLKIYDDRVYPVFVMEYIKNLSHGDEIIDSYHKFNAESLVKAEIYKSSNVDIFPGKDFLHPWNYFYDKENKKVRLIDFGRWTTGETKVSPYN